MDLAIKLSIENVCNKNGGPFGAVITDQDGKIISQGVNMVVKNNDPTAHAEIIAIRNACKILDTFCLENYSIYSSTEPCPMCYSAIRWARIDKIYYGNDRNDAEKIGFSDKDIYDEIENRNLNMIKIKDKNAIKAFELWKESNGIKY